MLSEGRSEGAPRSLPLPPHIGPSLSLSKAKNRCESGEPRELKLISVDFHYSKEEDRSTAHRQKSQERSYEDKSPGRPRLGPVEHGREVPVDHAPGIPGAFTNKSERKGEGGLARKGGGRERRRAPSTTLLLADAETSRRVAPQLEPRRPQTAAAPQNIRWTHVSFSIVSPAVYGVVLRQPVGLLAKKRPPGQAVGWTTWAIPKSRLSQG